MSGVQYINQWKVKLSVCCLLFTMFLTVALSNRVTAAPSASVDISLAVRQIFENHDTPVLKDVTYILKPEDSGFPLPSFSSNDEEVYYSFVIQGENEKELDPIIYDEAGVYTYILLPDVRDPELGVIYDNQTYTVRVYVRETVSGMAADVGVLNEDNEKVGGMVYRHKYIPLATDPDLMVDPPVNKTVAGNPGKKSTFTFQLQADDPSWPMPEGSDNGVKEMSIQGSGTKDFGTWSYTAAGTYTYTVSEVNAGDADYEYDTVVYTITDVVTDDSGQLVLDRTVTNASNKEVEGYDFINEYTGEDHPTPEPTVTPTPTPTEEPWPTSIPDDDGYRYYPSRGGIMYSGRPKTGDDSQAGAYQILLGLSGVVFVGCILFLVLYRRRKEEES